MGLNDMLALTYGIIFIPVEDMKYLIRFEGSFHFLETAGAATTEQAPGLDYLDVDVLRRSVGLI